MRFDADKTIKLPGPSPVVLPGFSLLVCVDAVGPIVEPALTKSPQFKRTEEGTLHVYQLAQPLPVGEWQPVVVVDGTTLYFATTRAFLEECRRVKAGLAQTSEFQEALAAVEAQNNGVTFVHPRFFAGLRQIESLNPNLPPQAKPIVTMLLSKVPNTKRPMIAVRTNLPDGILVRSYWDRSLKQELAMGAMYNPVSVGLLAAMAIPAFQKVRAASQEKAVLNNLRQLSAAADQYYLEHGADSVTYDELVGPDKYIREIRPVAGENYRQLIFKQGRPLRVRLANGKVVSFGP
jgi:type IV pilus assembly protein PilA